MIPDGTAIWTATRAVPQLTYRKSHGAQRLSLGRTGQAQRPAELSGDEADQVNAAIAEAKQINERHAGDARARRIMRQLDAQATSASGAILSVR